MNTDRLIATLARDIEPVQVLRRPWREATAWAGMASAYLAVLIIAISPWTALGLGLHDRRLVLEQGLVLFTTVTAAAAAFATVIPGCRRSIIALPVLGAAVLIVLVASRIPRTEWVALAMLGQTDWKCSAAILIGAAFPGVALITAIRRGALLIPSVTGLLAGLAAAAAGTFAVSAFRPHESSAIVLTWHFGTVLVVTVAAGIAGRFALRRGRNRQLLSNG